MSGLEGRNLAKVKKQNMAAVKTILYRQAPFSRVEIADADHYQYCVGTDSGRRCTGTDGF